MTTCSHAIKNPRALNPERGKRHCDIVRRGDALWTVTQRFAQLPIWLLQQYNPDVDLADLRPGTQIVMPKVENVAAGPN